jgi:outer membrane lipoprotein-sorting protein
MRHPLNTQSKSRPWAPAGATLVAGVAAAVVVCLFRAGVTAGSQDYFDLLHRRIAAAEAQRKSVRARFMETTTSSLLAKPVIRHGTLIASKPDRIVITYAPPEPKTIVMKGAQLFVIRPNVPEKDRVETIDIAEIMKKVDHYFTNASPDQLRRAFTIRAFPDPGAPGGSQIDLAPKRKHIKQGLEHLQIWVSPDDMLAQLQMTFAGGDTEIFKLEGVELNVAIPPGAFDVAESREKK